MPCVTAGSEVREEGIPEVLLVSSLDFGKILCIFQLGGESSFTCGKCVSRGGKEEEHRALLLPCRLMTTDLRERCPPTRPLWLLQPESHIINALDQDASARERGTDNPL